MPRPSHVQTRRGRGKTEGDGFPWLGEGASEKPLVGFSSEGGERARLFS